MKKIKYLIISLITIFAFNINVFAASSSLEVSSSNVYVGDSFTVTANISSAAAWNIHVSAIGPVSGCSINQADATADAMDTNKSFSATCTATATGTITLSLSGDVTSASDGNAVNISSSKNVTVSTRPTPPSNNNNSSNNNSSKSQAPTDNRSKNNNIKELSVEGYELVKVDNNNYTLAVTNDITSINIKATAEDYKAKVTGVGNHELNIGENNIEIVVTSESGVQNKIIINVTRKDAFYLEDLDIVLNSETVSDISIISDSKLSSQDIKKIKNSSKTISFNYYDENKNLIYSWILDGSKIDVFDELATDIEFKSNNSKEISKLSNYADGLYINMENKENLPNGTKIKLFVGDKYADEDLVNVYYYDNDDKELQIIKEGLTVKDNYIEFDVNKGSDYFITMSKINDANEVLTCSKSSNKSLIIITLLIIIAILIVVIIYFIKKKINNNNSNNNKSNTNNLNDLYSNTNYSNVSNSINQNDNNRNLYN